MLQKKNQEHQYQTGVSEKLTNKKKNHMED